MAERYEIRIKVISQEGTCSYEHKVGDEWILGKTTPQGICLSAYNALYPEARAMMFGASFPWTSDPDVTEVACPDAANPLVFELRRLRK